MRVAVTGATGTIGRALVERAARARRRGRPRSRATPTRARALGASRLDWSDPKAEPPPAEALSGARRASSTCSASRRPALDRRRQARDPRLARARRPATSWRPARAAEAERPRVLVSQSADRLLRRPRRRAGRRGRRRPGDDFLAAASSRTGRREARAAEELGVRVALTRTGVVLSDAGGALEKMLPPFKLGVGGPVAGGQPVRALGPRRRRRRRDPVRARHRRARAGRSTSPRPSR